MNITFYSNVTTKQKLLNYLIEPDKHNIKLFSLDEKEELIANGADTQVLVVDAMGSVDKDIIDAMPRLCLVQSEGVGYQGIDTEYLTQKGIPLCNNKGVNDTAVAETALMLMLCCLKQSITGHQSVYDGRQIEVKKASFGVVRELGECTVGLIGFGDIAKMTAKYCKALGARVIYSNRTRYTELESELGVEYVSQDTLLEQSDFVSLHVAVTPQTENMVDSAFLSKMKSEAFLINTSRGELVDNSALLDALLNNRIAGAGLDVIAPEPVECDNILLDKRVRDKLILTPHIAGITSLTVKKIYENIEKNINLLIDNKPLRNRVN